MKKLVIIGNGCFAKLINFFINTYSEYSVEAFSVDENYITEKKFCGRPVVAFEEISYKYNVDEFSVLVAIGYSNMNSVRQKKFLECEKLGYNMPSFIHPTAIIAPNSKIGKGNIIMERAIVQPFVEIGNSNILMSNAIITHDTVVNNFNTISASCTVAGFVNIGNNCFIGANSTVHNNINISDYTLVGASSYLHKSTKEYAIVMPNKCKISYDVKSTEFI